MKQFFLILSLLYSGTFKAQNCKCQNELDYVINYYEANLPGFTDNVNSKNQTAYNNFQANLLQQAKNYCTDENSCFKVLLTYVEFFKDNHSSIYQNNNRMIDEKNTAQVKSFLKSKTFKQHEQLSVPANQNASSGGIENTFQSTDGMYTVNIIKSKTVFRDYAAIITDSKTPLWIKGQVKFELKEVAPGTYDMFLYMRNHSLQYYKNVKLVNGILADEWFQNSVTQRVSQNINSPKELTFKSIDTETNYMYIPSFSANNYAKLNEFYNQHDSAIRSKPKLIIDVRNNGGGSDACVNPLLKYIYTKPFYGDSVDIYCTIENIRKSKEWYEQNKNDTVNFDQAYMNEVTEEIKQMQSVPNQSFIPRSMGELVSLDTVLPFPKKVAIIANKYCASSCETLLFFALESDKTILAGENSGGYVGYGEISHVFTPNFNFQLGCSMTRYKKQRQFEVIGISPQHYLNNQSDWVQQTTELLNSK